MASRASNAMQATNYVTCYCIHPLTQHLMPSDPAEDKQLYLNNTLIVALFVYYFVIIIAGLVLAGLTLIAPNSIIKEETSLFSLSLLGSCAMALNGSGIFYLRKLYKLCFSSNLTISADPGSFIQRTGTLIYFIARPIFSLGFALLVVIGIRASFYLLAETTADLTSGFQYSTMFVSFFVGFLSGRFVKQLESSGELIIEKLKP
jgi:hypothetical protein